MMKHIDIAAGSLLGLVSASPIILATANVILAILTAALSAAVSAVVAFYVRKYLQNKDKNG